MAYTEQRGTGAGAYYIARYSNGRGRWPTVKSDDGATLRFKKKRDAQKAGDDAEAEVRGGRWHDPSAGRETFGVWVNVWWPRQDLAPRTMGNYKLILETILLPAFEDDPLDDIDGDRIRAWERQLAASGYKPDSIRTYRGVLSVVLGDAAAEGKLDGNPVARPRGRGRRAGKARHRAPEKPVVTPAGALLLAERCAVMSGRDDEFILTVTKAWTGARWAELLGLERPYFRMSALRIEQQLEELDDGTWMLCPPKEDSRRDVDLPPFLAGLLSRQVAVTRAGRTARCSCLRGGEAEPHHGGTFLFTGRTTRRRNAKGRLVSVTAAHWRRSGFESMVFKPAAEGWYPAKSPRPRRPVPVTAEPFPGLPVRGRAYVERSEACWVPIADGLTPHLLRHSHRTWMVEDRIPEVLAHERLGHELGGVGARYSHVTDSMRAELMAALSKRWDAALDARLAMNPHSPVAVLDELLATRAEKRGTMIVPQNSHSGVVVGLRAIPRKRA